jgi:hypothetical protein
VKLKIALFAVTRGEDSMKKMIAGLAVAVLAVSMMFTQQAQAGGYGTCLAIGNQRNDSVTITVDGFPGLTWTYAPGEILKHLNAYGRAMHSPNADGSFTIHENISGSGDNRYVSWTWHSDWTEGGQCEGVWEAELHY